MNANFAKISFMLIVSLLFFAFSCKDDASDKADERLQVYNDDGSPIIGYFTIEIVGLPSERLNSGYYPWKLYGRIVNGKMDIDFPDVKLTLREGLQMDNISIKLKNSSSTRFGLYKVGTDNYDSVNIYYLTDDLIYNGINLKAGWNFVEEIRNPNWGYESDEPFYISRLISQDINEVLDKGYRWMMELWI